MIKFWTAWITWECHLQRHWVVEVGHLPGPETRIWSTTPFAMNEKMRWTHFEKNLVLVLLSGESGLLIFQVRSVRLHHLACAQIIIDWPKLIRYDSTSARSWSSSPVRVTVKLMRVVWAYKCKGSGHYFISLPIKLVGGVMRSIPLTRTQLSQTRANNYKINSYVTAGWFDF